jgi:hypothetical protein
MRTCLAILLTFGAAAAAAQDAALIDELAVIFPDSKVADGSPTYHTDTPRGVLAGVHVLVRPPENADALEFALYHGVHRVHDAQFYRLIDVPVEQNTGLGQRTELFGGRENPHVVRDAPFRVFEVLQPVESSVRVAPDSSLVALRVEVPIKPDAEAETRAYRLRISHGAWNRALPWTVEVWPVTVPPVRPNSPGFTNWLNTGNVARYHDCEPWTPAFWRMLERYADLMARGRQNTIILRWNAFLERTGPGQYTVRQQRLRRFVRIFLDRGFTRLEGGHLAHRHAGDWNSPRLDLIFSNADVTSDAGRAELAGLLTTIDQALRGLGAPDEVTYVQHLADEPTNTNAAAYSALAEQVRAQLPNVQIFEATMSRQLVGAVDIWCPQVYAWQKNADFFRERQAAGDAVWVYTCLSPGGPWMNRLLDQERLRCTLIAWALVKYDLDGFLHWGLNYQRKDPFEHSVVRHGKDEKSYLPAGDSHVIYPGADGPWSGQRFEAHRIGFEDAELLRLLKRRDPQRAAAVIERVMRSFRDYEKDVGTYRRAKRALLEEVTE